VLVARVVSYFFISVMFLVGKEKYVSVVIKNYLGMCLGELVLCLYSEFYKHSSCEAAFLHYRSYSL
jgi:uncharacterized membrane protein